MIDDVELRRSSVLLVSGDEIARYGFGDGHPFGPDRHEAFMRELHKAGLDGRVLRASPRTATREEVEAFHTAEYVDFVRERSAAGQGYLDGGDTPAKRGIFEAAMSVVGATLVGVEALMTERAKRAFIPIAGLHHAARDRAAGRLAHRAHQHAVRAARADRRARHAAQTRLTALPRASRRSVRSARTSGFHATRSRPRKNEHDRSPT